MAKGTNAKTVDATQDNTYMTDSPNRPTILSDIADDRGAKGPLDNDFAIVVDNILRLCCREFRFGSKRVTNERKESNQKMKTHTEKPRTHVLLPRPTTFLAGAFAPHINPPTDRRNWCETVLRGAALSSVLRRASNNRKQQEAGAPAVLLADPLHQQPASAARPEVPPRAAERLLQVTSDKHHDNLLRPKRAPQHCGNTFADISAEVPGLSL